MYCQEHIQKIATEHKLREHIISEIRRLAQMNGGQAPGHRMFEVETGIKRSQWYGVFWSKWGDALAAAGFEANAFQGPTDRDVILEKVAEAYRHFGHAATDGELRLYRTQVATRAGSYVREANKKKLADSAISKAYGAS